MIKSLKDARILDGLPRILAKQPWVRALSEAMGVVHEMTMAFADSSQIYTDTYHVTEDVLDALAVNWKIDWYDTDYNIEQKRRIVKTTLTVRKTLGTAAAVKSMVDAIYPGTTLQEWWEYGGEPGCFKVETHSFQLVYELDKFLAVLEKVKRLSSHLEKVTIKAEYQEKLCVGFAMKVGRRVVIDCEVPAAFDVTYLTDEHGDLLTDEAGSLLIIE